MSDYFDAPKPEENEDDEEVNEYTLRLMFNFLQASKAESN